MLKEILLTTVGVFTILITIRYRNNAVKPSKSNKKDPPTDSTDLGANLSMDWSTILPDALSESKQIYTDVDHSSNSVHSGHSVNHPSNHSDQLNRVNRQNKSANHSRSSSRSSKQFKGKVRCKYFPDCKYDKCVFQTTVPNDPKNPQFCDFWHPDIKCNKNNECQYENHCMFYHDKDFLIENRPFHASKSTGGKRVQSLEVLLAQNADLSKLNDPYVDL
eukprot:NODE_490_length_6857_cov_0.383249.p4 type:complete len:219 gc:universal NODE_490_length_6857_cov_0.383249:1713-2369(+)